MFCRGYPSFHCLIYRMDEFGWKHLSHPARPFGILKGDSEVQGTLKSAVISDTDWSKRPQGPQAGQIRGSQGKPVLLYREKLIKRKKGGEKNTLNIYYNCRGALSWAGTTTRRLGQTTSPGYSCGRRMAGLFLRLPERSPIIHPVMAPAGAHSSPTASREQGRKPTGATNLIAQLCLD